MKLLHDHYFRNEISMAEVPGARTKPTRTPHPLNQDRQPCFASITLAEHIKHYCIKHFHTPTAAPSHLPSSDGRGQISEYNFSRFQFVDVILVHEQVPNDYYKNASLRNQILCIAGRCSRGSNHCIHDAVHRLPNSQN
jgi:hypothetical protein